MGIFLDSIGKRDQAVRNTDYNKEKWIAADKANIDSLIWFSEKYGFPSYDLVGFADPGGGIGAGGTYWLVYWRQRGTAIEAFDSLGLKAVMEGNYPPDEFAMVYDFKRYPSRYSMLIPDIAEMDNEKDHFTIKSINNFRAAIYLETVEDYKRKLLFMQQQKPMWYSFILMPKMIYGMNSTTSNKGK